MTYGQECCLMGTLSRQIGGCGWCAAGKRGEENRIQVLQGGRKYLRVRLYVVSLRTMRPTLHFLLLVLTKPASAFAK